MAWWTIPVLFTTGLVAGFVDSVAGGGGLITWPVLLGAGVPVESSLGTNKLQAVFGSASASWNYARLGAVSPGQCKTGIICTVLGAAAGTLLVQHLDREFCAGRCRCCWGPSRLVCCGSRNWGRRTSIHAWAGRGFTGWRDWDWDFTTVFSGRGLGRFGRWPSCWAWVST